MVQVVSPRKTTEAVQDDVGLMVGDGLNYDDAAPDLSVKTGGGIELDGSGNVALESGLQADIIHGSLA